METILAEVDIQEKFGNPVTGIAGVSDLVSRIIQLLYVISGVILLALILWAGFEIISGAGTDDRERVGKGKKILTSAILGFLIVITSYWIIQIIGNIIGFKIV